MYSKIVSSAVGKLGVINLAEIPFEVKRVYWLSDTPPERERGLHAHKTLKQFIFCTSGSLDIVIDDGHKKIEHVLNAESEGILVDACKWRVLKNFSVGTSVVVLASEEYDPGDYIHDYSEFMAWISR
jgi:hypothetical protein